jgi:hypothetical protein
MLRQFALVWIVLLFASGQAQSAVLQVEGLASVDAGRGFTPATSNMQVNPGDRVRAGKGCALIVYHTGYESKICNGQMAVVVADPPSAQDRAVSLKDPLGPQPQAGPGLLVPGLLLGGGIALAFLLSNNHSHPQSP